MQRQYTILLSATLFLFSCSVTKHLPEGEKLYTGAVVNLDAPGAIPREKKVLKTDLQGLTRPRPNTRFIGIPIKLGIYNMFRKAKEKSFFGKLRNQYGEPPVLLSNVDLQQNVKVLQNHLENKGYFKAKVSADTVIRKKKAHAVYTAKAGNIYKINSVH